MQETNDDEGDNKPREVKLNGPEPLIGGIVDLGALATEFLILGLDPYPRKPARASNRRRSPSLRKVPLPRLPS